MRRALHGFLTCAALWLSALTASADARHTVLMDVLEIDELAQILFDEGQDYAQELNQDMMNGQGGAGWQMQVNAIYDPGRISEALRRAIEQELEGPQLEEAIAFFASDTGRKIIRLENSARVTMANPEVEEAARARFASLTGSRDSRLLQVMRMIDAGDLISRNVTSGMNSNYQFMRGLADGNVIEMSDAEILDDVMSERAEMEEDTTGWLAAFMLLAYSPLSDAELEAYVGFSESPAGLALNRGFFAGFDPLYEDIAYALGRAVALNMTAEEL